MGNICIIPARGGSKRIPRKNIKDFLGKPIIAYSIEAAIKSNLFDEVMVSTDDQAISKISKKLGASVPFIRSDKNSGDFSTTFDVLEEVIKNYKEINLEFKNICCLYPCAPFVTSEILIKSYNYFNKNFYDSVFPIVAYSYPIQRALNNYNGKVTMMLEENLNSRSQDLEKSFHDAGQFYFFNAEKLMRFKKIITSNSGGVVISELSAQDIDSETDWKLAELKYKLSITN